MTGKQIKQIALITLAAIAALVIGFLLLLSLTEPQISDRIELYETDLVLRATELQEIGTPGSDPQLEQWSSLQKAVFGDGNPIDESLKSYQQVRQSAEQNLQKFETRLQQVTPALAGENGVSRSAETGDVADELKSNIRQQQDLISQLDLRIGILQTQQNKGAEAIATWNRLLEQPQALPSQPIRETATVLLGLWSEPPRLLPDAESQIQRHLDGWFRYRTLTRLYELQQRPEQLAALRASEQSIAQDTLIKLGLLSGLQLFGGLIGAVLAIVWLVRWWFQRSRASVSQTTMGQTTMGQTAMGQTTMGQVGRSLAWDVPWNWEMILQVLLFAFILPGQLVAPIVAPLLLGIVGIGTDQASGRVDALRTTAYYLVMAGLGLTVMYYSLKPFFRLPQDWFRLAPKWNWVLWGVGGYFVALPLMVIVSNLNQGIWQGQGGSNPLLELVLRQQDGVAMGLFFFTAAIAAPVFEETLFRGFLLPSLTRYLPVWLAIGISGFVFALAHLSLSEVLPLTVLGCVLGFVYTRSRSLLAVMLLHSLWNSVTMLSLFVLGSSINS